jgi:hypothetical protein
MKAHKWFKVFGDRSWAKAAAVVTATALAASAAWAQTSSSGGGGAAGSGGLGPGGSGSGNTVSGSAAGSDNSGSSSRSSGSLSGRSSSSLGNTSDSTDLGSDLGDSSRSDRGDRRVMSDRRRNLDSSPSGGRSGAVGSDRGQFSGRDQTSISRRDTFDDQGSRSASSGRDRGADRGTMRTGRESRDEFNERSDRSFSDRGSSRDSRTSGRNLGLTFDDSEDQLTVSEVQRGSLASRIGLRDGDEILSVNGRRISSERDFYRWISQSQPGQRIPLEIWRDGDRRTVYWTGQFQEGARGQQYTSNQAQYQEGHAFLGVQLDQRFPNAAVVQQVYRNSPAEQAGLRPGDWIVSINGQRVSSSQDLTNEVSQLEPGAGVQIQISRPTTQRLQVRLGERSSANQASYEEDSRSYQTGSQGNYDESRSQGYSSGRSSRSDRSETYRSTRSSSANESSDEDSADLQSGADSSRSSNADNDNDYGSDDSGSDDSDRE